MTEASQTPRPARSGPTRPDRSTAVALIVFAAASVSVFGDVWAAGVSEAVPTSVGDDRLRVDGRKRRIDMVASDTRFVVWGVARNAYTLVSRPWALFDAEPCHPAPDTLAYGHPLITLGLVGVPVWLVTRDPITTYNAALLFISLVAALAMFLLVRDWTGEPAAGVAAGLLFAFDASKLAIVNYPFAHDLGWSVLGLFFARRLFAYGRLRDGLATGACGALQVGVSFYPFLAAALVAIPLLVWLLWQYGVRRAGLAAIAALALGALAAFWVFAPYLALRGGDAIDERSLQAFASWSALARGPALVCVALAGAGLLLPARRGLRGLAGADPRLALVAAALLVALMATGGNAVAHAAAEAAGEAVPAAFNPYTMLAQVLPGLDTVRVPAFLSVGVHLSLSVLAGIGAAGLLSFVPDARPGLRSAAGGALVLVVWIALRGLPVLGLEPRVVYRPLPIRPPEALISFYDQIASQGNDGPLFEAPINLDNAMYTITESSQQVLLTAYHHRRTSGCYNSYVPAGQERLERISRRLPLGLAELRELGFTTIVVRGRIGAHDRDSLLGELDRRADSDLGGLRRVGVGETHTAYEIEPPRERTGSAEAR